MKKLIYCLVLASILVLNTGCKKSSDVTAVTTGLSFIAQISYEDSTMECSTVIKKDGATEITVIKPSDISGLTVSFDGSTSLTYKGITHKLNGTLPTKNNINLIYDIFSNAQNLKSNVIKKGDGYILKGKTDFTNYEMLLGGSGLPIKITTSDGIEIIIKNATLINI